MMQSEFYAEDDSTVRILGSGLGFRASFWLLSWQGFRAFLSTVIAYLRTVADANPHTWTAVCCHRGQAYAMQGCSVAGGLKLLERGVTPRGRVIVVVAYWQCAPRHCHTAAHACF
jgi:hypothetical protein